MFGELDNMMVGEACWDPQRRGDGDEQRGGAQIAGFDCEPPQRQKQKDKNQIRSVQIVRPQAAHDRRDREQKHRRSIAIAPQDRAEYRDA